MWRRTQSSWMIWLSKAFLAFSTPTHHPVVEPQVEDLFMTFNRTDHYTHCFSITECRVTRNLELLLWSTETVAETVCKPCEWESTASFCTDKGFRLVLSPPPSSPLPMQIKPSSIQLTLRKLDYDGVVGMRMAWRRRVCCLSPDTFV